MYKGIKNWHLSVLIGLVSIISIALIQQYAKAQWTPPVGFPGETGTFNLVVNPVQEDLQLNGHKILDTNLKMYGIANGVVGSDNNVALDVSGDKKICLNGDCILSWAEGTNAIDGSGTIHHIPKFSGANTLTDSVMYEGVDGTKRKINIDYGAMRIYNIGGGYDLLELSASATASQNALLINNYGTGNSILVNDVLNDTSPFVLNANGNMGIGTSTPNKNLHIATPASAGTNAELDIQSGNNVHWGIYQDNGTGYLNFWNGDNNVTFTNDGRVGVGTITPSDELDVVGTGKFDSLVVDTSISANSVIASKGYVTELTAESIIADTGLTLNTPSIIMESTSGDFCTLELISDRVAPSASGGGHWNISCNAPVGVCGNSIVEPAYGEDCDPTGSFRYSYNVAELPLYDCGSYYNFERARISCEPSCQENSAICQCQFSCITTTYPKTRYEITANCGSNPTTICDSWGP